MARFVTKALTVSLLSIGLFQYPYFSDVMPISHVYAQTPSSSGFTDLVERLSPAVVNISTTSTVGVSPMDHFFGQGIPPEFNDLLENFFGGRSLQNNNGRQRKQEVKSLGSGFVIDSQGYVVTNHHVVHNADKIEINFPDGSNYKAEVIGSDQKTDLALVKIIKSDKKFPHVTWGDSKNARVGEWVIAIGNPYGLSGSVSAGIISALNRNINAGPYDSFIQTDAAINQGNSGGPLFNMNGDVIGVNSAIISPSGGSVGVGFAIPSSLAQNIITQIKEKGKVERGRLGIYFQPLTKDIADALKLPYEGTPKGVLIGNVEPDGPADRAGLKSGDIIVKVNDKDITESNELPAIVADLPIDQHAKLSFYRDGTLKSTDVKITKDEASESAVYETPTGGKFIKDIGISISNLSTELRSLYRIPDKLQGVIIEDDRKAIIDNFQRGDVILDVNQQPILDINQFTKIFTQLKSSKQPILFKTYRDGRVFFFAIRIPS